MDNFIQFIQQTKELFLSEKEHFEITTQGLEYCIHGTQTGSNIDCVKDIMGLIQAFEMVLIGKVHHTFKFNFAESILPRRFIGRWLKIFEDIPFSPVEATKVFNVCYSGIEPRILVKYCNSFGGEGKVIPYILTYSYIEPGSTTYPVNEVLRELAQFAHNNYSPKGFPYTDELVSFLENNKHYLEKIDIEYPTNNQEIYRTIQSFTHAQYWQSIAEKIPNIVSKGNHQEILGTSYISTENFPIYHAPVMTHYQSMGSDQDIRNAISYVALNINDKSLDGLVHMGIITQLEGETLVGITYRDKAVVSQAKEILLMGLNYYDELVLNNIDPISEEGFDNFSIAMNSFILDSKLPLKNKINNPKGKI